ncbi:MAG TPA: SAM-dependent methyltransferase [Thermoanaerobaculia bacterium]|jgi:hypothetical protein|nr:SAM-dependent methyltransferase [Thermoanaerobaculia bacterium]
MDRGGYPSREEAVVRWEALAAEMAKRAGSLSDAPSVAETPGHLIIIGSGIQSIGFTLDAIQVLESADYVFYCVADPATQVFIRELRPDAFDLYVFYDDMKVRYHTYMQMTEAMLHYVRLGKSVAAVYYGHPGVFVLSTHRAVAIARREGHRAEMRAGVSALDCLCADLGVDPSYPGMQTFEATDMLLRARVPDISSHVVLWQVGVIGEMSFRRKGFVNDRFAVLVDYLERYYGPDHLVTHYIGSRVPTVAPVIERYTIAGLRAPEVRQRVNGVSTFYIPPKEARTNDPEMARALGLPAVRPGSRGHVLRIIDRYSKREMDAVHALSEFRVPADYHHQDPTPAARFLIELTRDAALQKRFIADAAEVVADPRFGLSARDRALLASGDPGRMAVAAKAHKVPVSPFERFVLGLLADDESWIGFAGAVRENLSGGTPVDEWLAARGLDVTLSRYAVAAQGVASSSLAAWSGIYGGDVVVAVAGNPANAAKSVIRINGRALQRFLFASDALTWNEQDSIGAGSLRFSMPAVKDNHGFRRGVAGTLRLDGREMAVSLSELTPDELPNDAAWALDVLPPAAWIAARRRAHGCFRAVPLAAAALRSRQQELIDEAREVMDSIEAGNRDRLPIMGRLNERENSNGIHD